jgi:hypothetical protein
MLCILQAFQHVKQLGKLSLHVTEALQFRSALLTCHHACHWDINQGEGTQNKQDIGFQELIRAAWNNNVGPITKILCEDGLEYLLDAGTTHTFADQLKLARERLDSLLSLQASAIALAQKATKEVNLRLKSLNLSQKLETYVETQILKLGKDTQIARDIMSQYKGSKEKAEVSSAETETDFDEVEMIKTFALKMDDLAGLNKKQEAKQEKRLHSTKAMDDQIQKKSFHKQAKSSALHQQQPVAGKRKQVEQNDRQEQPTRTRRYMLQAEKFRKGLEKFERERDSMIKVSDEIQKKVIDDTMQLVQEINPDMGSTWANAKPKCGWDLMAKMKTAFEKIIKPCEEELQELEQKKKDFLSVFTEWTSPGSAIMNICRVGMLRRLDSNIDIEPLKEKGKMRMNSKRWKENEDKRIRKIITKLLPKVNMEIDHSTRNHYHGDKTQVQDERYRGVNDWNCFSGCLAEYCLNFADFSCAVGKVVMLLDQVEASQIILANHCENWDAWIAPIYAKLRLTATAQLFEALKEMHNSMEDPVEVICKRQHMKVASFAKGHEDSTDTEEQGTTEDTSWCKDAVDALQLVSSLCSKYALFVHLNLQIEMTAFL